MGAWHPQILRFYVLIGTSQLSFTEQKAPAVSNSFNTRPESVYRIKTFELSAKEV